MILPSKSYPHISWWISGVLMLLSWGIGLYFYSIVFSRMVIYIDRYYLVHPFWGLLAGAAAATLFTVGAVLFAMRTNHFRSPKASGTAASVAANFIWIVTLYFQIAAFNLNEGICH